MKCHSNSNYTTVFFLSHESLEVGNYRDRLFNPKAGACVVFEGRVRDHNEGNQVVTLEYQAYEVMAQKEGCRILEQALTEFDILQTLCAHRIGKLVVGDIAVWIGVIASHRKAAFEACETILCEIKYRLPIWKKEYYTTGSSSWINCNNCSNTK